MNVSQNRLEIPGFQSGRVEVNGVAIHYWVGGDPQGEPVLLWHGFLGTGYSWHRVAPLLVESGYAVLIPDMRGYGDSDKPSGTDGYDGLALAEEFRSLRKFIGFGEAKPLILVGHDMGAPPAILWAAAHPEEIKGVVYVEGPVMLQEMLGKIMAYTPEAMDRGSMWWWIVPLAPGVPEILIVGKEREFLNWFYRGPSGADTAALPPNTVDEYLRTFSGAEGVLGAVGVYRSAFTTIEQTAPLLKNKLLTPVVAIGGERGLGAKVGQFLSMVAADLTSEVIARCGHFVPEERPEVVFAHVLKLSERKK